MITSAITTCSMEGHRRCTHVSDQFSLSYAFHAHGPPSINVCIDASHPPRSIARTSTPRPAQLDARRWWLSLRKDSRSRRPRRARRSRREVRGLDAMMIAFVRSEGFDGAVDGVGRREARRRRRRLDRGGTRERYATEIRDRGERATKTRASRARRWDGRDARAETRCILCVHRRPSRARVRRVARGRRDATRTTDG